MDITLPLKMHKPKGQASSAAPQPVRNAPAAYVPQMRVLVVIGVLLMAHFLWWFADDDHIGYAPLFWLLTVSLGFKCLKMLHEWYHYIQVSEPVAPATFSHQQYTVDMLTTACPGEPRDMIVRTLQAMQAVTYPHTSYLCDEGNDPYLQHVCTELGVVHVTRQVKVNAKAGNINHALQQATGELCVVLDPDHVPTPDFLDTVVPYFADPTVGYAQVVQAYSNQKETLVALGAAEQTYQFYGPLMMGMNSYNTAQAIGANCTFRRAALDSIGGHAAGLTEDMHTAMRLHAAGWKSVYVPAIISRGLVPASLAAFFAQQLKWARGSFDLLFHVYPRLFTRFTWRQKLHYATLPLYFFSGVITLIDIGVPIVALLMIEFPWHLSLGEFALHMTPLLLMSLLIRYNAQRWLREPHEAGLHLAGGFLRIGTWWIYCLGLIYTILGVRVPYIPTPKEGCGGNEWQLCLPNIALAALSVGAARYGHYLIQTPYALMMMALAMSNAAFLMVSVLMAQHDLLKSLKRLVSSNYSVQNRLQKAEQWLAARVGATLPRFRTAAVYMAFFLITLHSVISAGVEFWHHHVRPSASLIWAHTGEGGLRIGHSKASSSIWSASVSPASQTAGPSAPAVVELWLRPASAPLVQPDALKQLDAQGSLPLLSWEVKPEVIGSSEWERRIGLIKKHTQPLLLRPIIRATNPAAYRAAWQQLVTSFRTAGISGSAWVWTPPRPDSVAAYFPGSAFTDWVAADYLSSTPATLAEIKKPYNSLRLQLAERAELNSKPIFMFALAQPGQPQQAQAKRFIQQYPEVKALIFGSPRSQQPEVVVLNTQPSL